MQPSRATLSAHFCLCESHITKVVDYIVATNPKNQPIVLKKLWFSSSLRFRANPVLPLALSTKSGPFLKLLSFDTSLNLI
jgi:hypothetical protein